MDTTTGEGREERDEKEGSTLSSSYVSVKVLLQLDAAFSSFAVILVNPVTSVGTTDDIHRS